MGGAVEADQRLGNSPLATGAQIIYPKSYVIERRLMGPRTLLRIDGLQEVHAHAKRARSRHRAFPPFTFSPSFLKLPAAVSPRVSIHSLRSAFKSNPPMAICSSRAL